MEGGVDGGEEVADSRVRGGQITGGNKGGKEGLLMETASVK